MKLLTDEALIDAYRKSLNLELEQDFINLLLEEIYQRNIDLELI
ncbi:sporulation histidine kinase inhibitor Sda [Ammoniphilus resinae]|uniref:Developmental checkpoint coupling sporulation initiation to replication initiation n=1 Tax=Ammoniphilus resinae TaxID=861532 RepID=A0ABS4GKZ5_9BACL|nr:sporulation histidine kinase inhibitor Sda [Ammoniphilus resinae]MBP1930772.1 developmental checkpoint coupling sporulation initiation to replication initiation [Ammoniphilus resinae]